MSVHKIKRGRSAVYKVRYRDHSGNAKSETYDLKADADARDAEIRRAKQRKEPIPPRGRGGSGDNIGRDSIRVEHANANGVIGTTKTSQPRTVKPLIPALARDLGDWRKMLSEQTKPTRYRNAADIPKASDLVIAQHDGSPWTTSDYGNFRARVFKKHLPPDAHAGARVDDLRHGYASLLIRQGDDLAPVAKRMGNNPTTTAQHYTHVFEDYDGKPKAIAEVVAAARLAAGHIQDTSQRDTQGHEGMPQVA